MRANRSRQSFSLPWPLPAGRAWGAFALVAALASASAVGCASSGDPAAAGPSQGAGGSGAGGKGSGASAGAAGVGAQAGSGGAGGASGGAPACTAGSVDCACKADGGCDAGLVCKASRCVTAASGTLQISAPDARACDVLLTEGKAHVEAISFGEGVRGTFIREAPKVALSVVSTKDTSMPADGIKVSLVGGGMSDLQVKRVDCVNAKAQPITGAKATVQ